MKPCFYSFCCRLPGGERFNDFIKCILAYLKHPRAFPSSAFHNSLHHFFLGGDYGIIIPRDGVEIPDKLYHVTSEKNLDNILKKGISSACGVVFLTDSFQDLEDYLEWKQIHRKNWDKIFLLTINTKLCREQGIGICKINRDREFIAQGVPPEAIIACGNFQEQLASNRHGN